MSDADTSPDAGPRSAVGALPTIGAKLGDTSHGETSGSASAASAATVSTPPRPTQDAALVIFGASGDLMQRKLMPALYVLERDGLLPPKLQIVGIARRPVSVDSLHDGLRAARVPAADHPPLDEAVWQRLAARIQHVRGDLEDPALYAELTRALAQADARGAGGNRLYYLATPPAAFPIAVP